MLLAEEEVSIRETALTLAGQKEEEEKEAHLLPPLLSTAAQQHSCTSTYGCVDCNRARAYLHIATTLLRPFGILVCPSDKTIIEQPVRIRNDGSAQENRNFSPLILVHLVILVLLLSLLPTVKAFGLGHFHQQRNPTLHRPASPPLYDPERATDGTLTEDSTVKIRTREVENPPPPPPLPPNPLQQVENPLVEPWLYNVPAVDPNLQRAAAFTPVFVPNYNYYTVYGTPWSYPETRLVGAYAPSAPPVSQWNPQAQYYYTRNPAQYRRKPGDKKRRDKFKGEKCQKICETCLRGYDGAGEYVLSHTHSSTLAL
ncbi:hypothetical protein TSMEX_008066 [Taenia solium]|eukprot:TsM_000643900 transcript=TsM_000643900 gene=TsM_000643900